MLQLKCKTCGREFSSIMLYDMHIATHSPLRYLQTFVDVANHEIAAGRGANLQQLLDITITPQINKLLATKVSTVVKREQSEKLKKHEDSKKTKKTK